MARRSGVRTKSSLLWNNKARDRMCLLDQEPTPKWFLQHLFLTPPLLYYGRTSKEDPTHKWVLHSTSLQGPYRSLLGWSFPSVLSPPLHTLHLQTLACYPKSNPYRVAFKQKRAHKTRDSSVLPPGAAALH